MDEGCGKRVGEENERWYSPREIARIRSIRTSKVLLWISRGELEALNLAERPDGRPRWRISASSLAAFDSARSNRARISPPRPRRAHRNESVTEYF